MHKNMSSAEGTINADNSSMQGSDGELFVHRVASSGVLLKFKVGKYGKLPTSSNVLSHELTVNEKQSARGQPENIEANTQSLLEQAEISHAEPKNKRTPFKDSATGSNPDEEISRAQMVNNSSKEVDRMVSLKTVALMDTFTTGINGSNSAQNAKMDSKENEMKTGNHEISASEKSCSCRRSEEHTCDQCGKRFKSIDSFYGHMGGHRREGYQLIRMMLEQPSATGTSCTVIDKKELKKTWKATQALLKISMVSGRPPVPSTEATAVIRPSKDISSGVTTDVMEVADLLVKLSQTVSKDVLKVPAAAPSAGVFMCTTCSKIFDSYQALGGHVSSSHNKPRIRKLGETAAGNSSGSGDPQNWKFLCNKCNERFPTGPSLGGHKRKHWFEEHKMTPVSYFNNEKARVSLPSYTMQASETVLPVHDDL